MSDETNDRPLRICILSYRSDPYCGGQGVYIKNLTRAIRDIGHYVDVVSGPPSLILDPDVPQYRMPSLDLYNHDNLFRVPTLRELTDPINILEWVGVSTMGFPEPFVFGIRAKSFLKDNSNRYDVIHDNQSLSYGVRSLSKIIPTIATIHHPMTKDRDIALNSATSVWEKFKYLRWYSFIGMQKRVSKTLPRIITVSQCSKNDICEEFGIPHKKLRVIPNGINTNIFHPLNGVRRQAGRIIVTNSSDTPLKGLNYLLKAIANLSLTHKICLFIVGVPKVGGNILKLICKLGIKALVKFTGRIDDRELVFQYAKASVAVVPSIYEGFGLPAGEAMACGVPVVSTTGGALPEVVGDVGILIPPGNYLALSGAIAEVLDNSVLAASMSEAGVMKVQNKLTWAKTAEKTIRVYKEVIN